MTQVEFESSILRENPMDLREHNLLKCDFPPGLTSPRTVLAFPLAPVSPGGSPPPFLPVNYFENQPVIIVREDLTPTWTGGLGLTFLRISGVLVPHYSISHRTWQMAVAYPPPSQGSSGDSQKEKLCLHLRCYWNLVHLLAWNGALANI